MPYTVECVGARREQVMLGTVAAAVLVAIVAFAAAGTGVRNQQATPTPTPQPRPAADRDLSVGSLQPGVRYHTRAFIPALSFEVADTEWIVTDAGRPNMLTLERAQSHHLPAGHRAAAGIGPDVLAHHRRL